MYVCMRACMHACMYVCMYVYMYVCMYALAWTCAYPCTGFCGSDHVESLQLCCQLPLYGKALKAAVLICIRICIGQHGSAFQLIVLQHGTNRCSIHTISMALKLPV